MQPYRTVEWKAFRSEVIRLDGGVCTMCGRGPSNNIRLHVHHKQYIKGKLPWQYPYNLCETLCAGCHSSIHGHTRPPFGWEYGGWEDLGEPVGECDCCHAQIRYVFHVYHEKWHSMEVGETCCDNLTSENVASDFMESKRRHADRLKRFLSSSRWQIYAGDIHHIVQKKLIVRVAPAMGGYHIFINGIMGKKQFPDALSGKAEVFTLIESGKIHDYLAKKNKKRT